MTPERWQQVEKIYNAALERPPHQREEFVIEACGRDEDLRRDLLAMLKENASSSGVFLNRPAWEQAPALDPTTTVPAPGTRFGPYEIEAPLGAGGMGTVFRARDTRLGRAVALKICQAQFSNRFDREAQAISALNHPHICALYDVGPNYLVMELVEGDTLAARLKKGPLPSDSVVRYGAQLADALAAAHARGIIHRDLKPGNIMLTKTGVKVLDFGLAKSAQDETLTSPNVALGTPAYMAPEQREGKECDARTDIYALGLILREMITGTRHSDSALGASPQLAHVVERCLAADPDDRWQSAKDVRRELEWSAAQPAAQPESPAPNRVRPWTKWLLAGAIAAIALSVLFIAARALQTQKTGTPKVVRLALPLPEEGAVADPGRLNGPPVISPDGSVVVLPLGRGDGAALWMRRLGSDQFVRLNGTEGGGQPFWSPDGKQIAFFAGDKLKKMRLPDGAPQDLSDVHTVEARGGAWSSRGTILFGVNYDGLMSIPENGGSARAIAGLDPKIQENSLRFPAFLGDGNHFIYFSRTLDPQFHAIYLDALDTVGKQPRKLLVAADGPAAVGHDPFSGRDFLLFPKGGKLWAQQFNSGTGALSGEKTAISEDVGQFSVSSTGTLVYRQAGSEQNRLAWFDRLGRSTGAVGELGDYWEVGLSPDERYVSALNHRSAEGRFWVEIIDLARNVQSAVSDPKGRSFGPTWSRDSRRLYFTTVLEQGNEIRVKEINAAGLPALVARMPDRYDLRDLSPDGKIFLANLANSSIHYILSISPVNEMHWRPLDQTGAITANGQFSPDGHWIAYQSNESGASEIYLTDFPEMRRKLRVSTAGGSVPRWRGNGKELFYVAGDSMMMAAPIEGFSSGKPAPLFKLILLPEGAGFPYAVTRDGQRFLGVDRSVPSSARDLSIVFNWPQLIH